MNNFFRTMIISILVLFSVNASAVGTDYKCTVDRFSLASGDTGKLYEYYKKLFIGNEFTVNRATGYMTGALKNSYVTAPQVIDFGSTENSYKVVTTMRKDQGIGNGSNIYALTINEYEATRKKPFVFMANDKVFFGTCVSY